jgi:hypothetical protein
MGRSLRFPFRATSPDCDQLRLISSSAWAAVFRCGTRAGPGAGRLVRIAGPPLDRGHAACVIRCGARQTPTILSSGTVLSVVVLGSCSQGAERCLAPASTCARVAGRANVASASPSTIAQPVRARHPFRQMPRPPAPAVAKFCDKSHRLSSAHARPAPRPEVAARPLPWTLAGQRRPSLTAAAAAAPAVHGNDDSRCYEPLASPLEVPGCRSTDRAMRLLAEHTVEITHA